MTKPGVLRKMNVVAMALIFGFAGVVRADIILLGNDTNTAAAEYSLGGSFLASLGPSGATGTTFDGLGHAYVAYGGENLIRELDSAGNVLNTISVTGPEDIAFMNNTLWVSQAFSASGVTHIDLNGNVLSGGFAAAFGTGLESDGTFLYSSDGFGGSGVISQRLADGTLTGVTINTGFGSNLSLGWDAGDKTFWLGGSGVISEYDLLGNLVVSYSIPHFHDGISVGDFNAVPEPASLLLMGSVLVGLAVVTRRRRRA